MLPSRTSRRFWLTGYMDRFEGRAMYMKTILAVALLCLPVTSVFGQVSGRLSGSVVDASNAAVPNAKVSITIPGGTATVVETETNSVGAFSINSARPDQYDLVVEKTG